MGAWALIAGFFLFAVAATSLIPFSNTPIPLATVVRGVGFPGLFSQLFQPGVVLALAISAVPIVVATFSRSRRLRIAIPLLCLIGPLLWFTVPTLLMSAKQAEIAPLLPAMLLKVFAQWVLVMPMAPYFTFSVVTGRVDGEFYAEGMMVYTAFGWWMILCLALLLLEWMRRRERKDAPLPGDVPGTSVAE